MGSLGSLGSGSKSLGRKYGKSGKSGLRGASGRHCGLRGASDRFSAATASQACGCRVQSHAWEAFWRLLVHCPTYPGGHGPSSPACPTQARLVRA